jgi:iodotyrosine deiodinase
MTATPDPGPRVPFTGLSPIDDVELRRRAAHLHADLSRRRTVRHFSGRRVPQAAIDDCLRVALSAPSGANQQPWHFVSVSDPSIKARIREAAEEEERAFYQGRAPTAWLDALGPLGTDEHKPFLEEAPCLIVIFAQLFGGTDSDKTKHYYVQESVGIATGMLIAALHQVGLASLTHTPSPMRFLNDILGRPSNERPFLILVVGHPAVGATVPDIARRPFDTAVTHL